MKKGEYLFLKGLIESHFSRRQQEDRTGAMSLMLIVILTVSNITMGAINNDLSLAGKFLGFTFGLLGLTGSFISAVRIISNTKKQKKYIDALYEAYNQGKSVEETLSSLDFEELFPTE